MAWLLAMPVDVLFGPFSRDRMLYVIPAIAAVVYWPLLRYNRYRRMREARREQAGESGPPKGASLLLAGVIALALAAFGIAALLRGAGNLDARAAEGIVVLASAGLGAIALGYRRIGARRAWRATQRDP